MLAALALAVPLLSAAMVLGAALKGLGRVFWGQLPELLIRPALSILCLAGLLLFFDKSPTVAVSGFLAGATLTALATVAVLAAALRREGFLTRPVFERDRWTGYSRPMLATQVLLLGSRRLDILLVGFLLSEPDLGLYAICTRLVAVVEFGTTALQALVDPRLAKESARGNLAEVNRITVRSARWSFLIAVAIFAVLLAALPLGAWFFDVQMGDIVVPVCILAAALVLSSTTGALKSVLAMAGRPDLDLRLNLLCVVAGFLIIAPLTLAFGLLGAAIGGAAAILIRALLFGIAIRGHVGAVCFAWPALIGCRLPDESRDPPRGS